MFPRKRYDIPECWTALLWEANYELSLQALHDQYNHVSSLLLDMLSLLLRNSGD